MSKLLEILGRAIAVDTADLICHWLQAVTSNKRDSQSLNTQQLFKVIELISDMKLETAEQPPS